MRKSFCFDDRLCLQKPEDGICKSVGSTYKQIHLLCKSQTVEKLDTCNLEVLASFKTKVKEHTVLESINPWLKPFIRGKKTSVEAGIQSLLKLVTHRHSGNTTSQADTFDHICVRKEVEFIEAIYRSNNTAFESAINIMAHDFSFMACQHNLFPRQTTALWCQVVNRFMPNKVDLVFSSKQMSNISIFFLHRNHQSELQIFQN